MNTEKIDLSLVLFEDIYEELKKRYDAFIFVYVNTKDKEHEEFSVNYKGGKLVCVGLAKICEAKLLETMVSEIENKEDREDKGEPCWDPTEKK